MSNPFFQFKEFAIHQDKCAMKVCTDSCLFGAWMIEQCKEKGLINQQVLDIGSGTGLLSLMYAQNFNSKIDLIEIDKQASIQSYNNAHLSPWKEKMTVHHTSLQHFNPVSSYDFIFSNPPFFENDLPSKREEEITAKHSSQLLLSDILQFASVHLNQNGSLAIMIPYKRMNAFQKLLNEFQFEMNQVALIKQHPNKEYFRVFYILSRSKNQSNTSEIIICDEYQTYTDSFKKLLKAYYLAL